MNTAKAYLDTNVLIAFIEERRPEVLRLFERAARAEIEVVTSAITFSEVLVKPLEQKDEATALLYTSLLTTGKIITVAPVSLNVLLRSAELRARLGGKLPDAIHVATALETGCDHLVSADKGLKIPGGLPQLGFPELSRL